MLFDFNTEFEILRPSAEEFSARSAGLLERYDFVVLLAEDGERPVGLAVQTLRLTHFFDGPLAQLEELYVRPALRDQGIGTALLEEAIRLVRGLDGEEMHINIDDVAPIRVASMSATASSTSSPAPTTECSATSDSCSNPSRTASLNRRGSLPLNLRQLGRRHPPYR